MPLINLWQPLYTHLALRGRARGVRGSLPARAGTSGSRSARSGGSPACGASTSGRCATSTKRISSPTTSSARPLLKNLLWRYGVRWTARNAAVQGLEFAAHLASPRR